jgi:hypothetical protein
MHPPVRVIGTVQPPNCRVYNREPAGSTAMIECRSTVVEQDVQQDVERKGLRAVTEPREPISCHMLGTAAPLKPWNIVGLQIWVISRRVKWIQLLPGEFSSVLSMLFSFIQVS